jgi:hypothetical protein
MSLLHPNGQTCAVGELDLHAVAVTQKDILKSQTVLKTTNNALTDHTDTFDFTFEPTSLYTDLSETELYMEFEVVDAAGTRLAVADEAAPVNNIGHALFNSVQLLINGEKVTGNNEDYTYKSNLLDTVGTEKRDKETRLLGCQKWLKDTAGHMDARTAENSGWTARRAEFAARRTHCVVVRPHIDLLKQCKLLPSHCELKFIYERSSPAFYMMQAPDLNFWIKITKAEMSLRQVTVRDEVVEVHNKMVMNPQYGPFNYPITRCKVTKHTLDGGSQEYSWTQPDTTQIPSRLLLCMVKETAASGAKGENPYHYKNYHVKEVLIKFDDQKFEVKTDFERGNSVRAYSSLFKETGLLALGQDCDLTLKEFQEGYTIFAFDLTPDRTPEDSRINLLRQGKLTVSLRFAAPTTHAISAVICAFYDNNIQLTADRLPVTDYHMS